MPIITNPIFVGNPGSVISTLLLNESFDDFTAEPGNVNLRVDCVHTNHIQQTSVNVINGAARNTSSTPTTYIGTTYQAITHGAAALNVGPFNLLTGQTLRIHWHQYVAEAVMITPTIADFVSFDLQWDIGAGFVAIPNTIDWRLSMYTESSIGILDQTLVHNMTAGWCYTNIGPDITVTAVRLRVRPNSTELTGTVSLVEGTLIYVIQGPI